MNASDAEALSEAIVLWTGWRHATSPKRDDERVKQALGADAERLLPRVHAAEDVFYESGAKDVARDLTEMGALAVADFRLHYPDLSDEAVEALAWCYTFDYK